ncbi:hypothetical protein SAMD00019534_098670 [Acytostelium subglobosum LB1]|uniref:hypothetical protein n=1 Tax=Acytostelium subglobosum LB1 TaxID=1410327 RepID=UPI000644F8F5|nr:hypothetical protein SAMD00019534_098670 [Acytostelium subglobosum LB1]GAM26692.1 hypothetical protein SAMD00019534_098670 [Acytostelium subglobosum LB1]|eukprot:XP_012750353.1 hypothetical protein SAMD00019534_098670 [Acytostelium subglobosum LB1]
MFSFLRKRSSTSSVPNNNVGSKTTTNASSQASSKSSSSQRHNKTVIERKISVSDGGAAPRDAVSLGHGRSEVTRSDSQILSRLFQDNNGSKKGGSSSSGRKSTYTEKEIFPGGVKRGVKGIMMVGEGNEDVLSRARTYINTSGELHFTDEDLDQYMLQPSSSSYSSSPSPVLNSNFPTSYTEPHQPVLRVPNIVSMSKFGFEQDDEDDDMFWDEEMPSRLNGLSQWAPNSPEIISTSAPKTKSTQFATEFPQTQEVVVDSLTLNDNNGCFNLEDLTTSQVMAHIEREEEQPALSELEDADFPTEDISKLDTSVQFIVNGQATQQHHQQHNDDDTISQLSDATDASDTSESFFEEHTPQVTSLDDLVDQLPVSDQHLKHVAAKEMDDDKRAAIKASYEAGILELEQLELEVLGSRSSNQVSVSVPVPVNVPAVAEQQVSSEQSTPTLSPLLNDEPDIFKLLSDMIASPFSNQLVNDSIERLKVSKEAKPQTSLQRMFVNPV